MTSHTFRQMGEDGQVRKPETQRDMLRQHPDVVHVLEKWWAAASNDVGRIGRIEYAAFHEKAIAALVDRPAMNAAVISVDMEEAMKMLENDWDIDSGGGKDEVTQDCFSRSVFDIIDRECSTAEAKDYVNTGKILFTRVFKTNSRGSIGEGWRRVYASWKKPKSAVTAQIEQPESQSRNQNSDYFKPVWTDVGFDTEQNPFNSNSESPTPAPADKLVRSMVTVEKYSILQTDAQIMFAPDPPEPPSQLQLPLSYEGVGGAPKSRPLQIPKVLSQSVPVLRKLNFAKGSKILQPIHTSPGSFDSTSICDTISLNQVKKTALGSIPNLQKADRAPLVQWSPRSMRKVLDASRASERVRRIARHEGRVRARLQARQRAEKAWQARQRSQLRELRVGKEEEGERQREALLQAQSLRRAEVERRSEQRRRRKVEAKAEIETAKQRVKALSKSLSEGTFGGKVDHWLDHARLHQRYAEAVEEQAKKDEAALERRRAEAHLRKQLGLPSSKMTLEELQAHARQQQEQHAKGLRIREEVAAFERRAWQDALEQVKREQAAQQREQLERWREKQVMRKARELEQQIEHAEKKYRGVAAALMDEEGAGEDQLRELALRQVTRELVGVHNHTV